MNYTGDHLYRYNHSLWLYLKFPHGLLNTKYFKQGTSKALEGHRGFQINVTLNRYITNCSINISNPSLDLHNSFSRTSLLSLDLHSPFFRITIRKSRARIVIRENELCKSREWISYPWEQIAQFVRTIYICVFKIPFFFYSFLTRLTPFPLFTH